MATKSLNRPLLSVLIAAFWVVSAAAPTFSADGSSALSFKWAFGALSGPTSGKKLISVRPRSVLHTGDQMKMMVEPIRPCYIYLLYERDGEDLSLLFPGDFSLFKDPLAPGKRIYLPDGNQWFTLDNQTGIEKFHLLVSTTRRMDFESLIMNFKQGTAADKITHMNQVTTHLRDLKKEQLRLAKTAERPIQIGGGFRDVDSTQLITSDISLLSTEINGQDFYIKTYSIEHKE